MTTSITESTVEEFALEDLRYAVVHGPTITADAPRWERLSYGELVLRDRLLAALERINPHVLAPPSKTLEVLSASLTEVDR
jgi:type I restriction enzyme R subunit